MEYLSLTVQLFCNQILPTLSYVNLRCRMHTFQFTVKVAEEQAWKMLLKDKGHCA